MQLSTKTVKKRGTFSFENSWSHFNALKVFSSLKNCEVLYIYICIYRVTDVLHFKKMEQKYRQVSNDVIYLSSVRYIFLSSVWFTYKHSWHTVQVSVDIASVRHSNCSTCHRVTLPSAKTHKPEFVRLITVRFSLVILSWELCSLHQ